MDPEILVVGAGIAGLTVAAKLQAHGFGVQIAERAAALRTATAGIVLHPNALACLDHLGPRLSGNGAPIEHQVSIDPDGTLTLVHWRQVWRDQGVPLAIHRRVLAELMYASLRPGTVMWSTTPRTLIQRSDAVAVTFADGVTARYKLVIGADGVGSWVRQALGEHPDARFSGQTFLRTTVRATDAMDFPDWRVWRSEKHFFGAMPIGHGRMAIFLQTKTDEPFKVAPEDAYRVLCEATRSMPVGDIVSAMCVDEEFRARPAYLFSTGRRVRGRVAIIGDAAHSFSPATTQGGAMALEDAAVLAEEIARRGCRPDALNAFERRRRARVGEFTRLARLHVTLMHTMQNPDSRRYGPGGTTDASRWYRRLYGPLLASP